MFRECENEEKMLAFRYSCLYLKVTTWTRSQFLLSQMHFFTGPPCYHLSSEKVEPEGLLGHL